MRDREAVEEVAAAQGFVLAEPLKMPANNQLLVFAYS